MSVHEYQELLSIEIGQTELDKGNFPSNMAVVIAACCGLVYIDEEDRTVHYVHHSVRRHLVARNGIDIVPVNEAKLDLDIGKLCLTYLSFNDFQRQLLRYNQNSTTQLSPIQIGLTSVSKSGNVVAQAAQKLIRYRSQHKNMTFREIESKTQEILGISSSATLASLIQSQQYFFLNYAKDYWIYHLTNLFTEYNSTMWKLFSACLGNDKSLAEKPWANSIDFDDKWDPPSSKTAKVFRWCTKNTHPALLLYTLLNDKYMAQQEGIFSDLCNTRFLHHHYLLAIVIQHGEIPLAILRNGQLTALRNGCLDCEAQYSRLEDMVNHVSAGNEDKIFHLAVEKGDHDVVMLLLAAGADVNATGENGTTALNVASRYGHLEIVRTLLEAGVNMNASSEPRGTALHYASNWGYVEIVKTLLVAGADVNASNTYEGTALNCASNSGHIEIVKTLLAAGTDMNASNKYQETALHLVSRVGHLEIARTLLEAGVDANAFSETWGTALHLASKAGHLGIVRTLLEAGTDTSILDPYGWTALQWAREKGYKEIVAVLEAHVARK